MTFPSKKTKQKKTTTKRIRKNEHTMGYNKYMKNSFYYLTSVKMCAMS